MAKSVEISIDELCREGVVELQTGPFGSQLHAHDYVDEAVPVVPTEAIRDRRIIHDGLPHISEAKSEELNRHRLLVGDILFARRGVQATGQSAIIRKSEAGFVCGTGAIRLRLKHNNNKLLPSFLSHVLMAHSSIQWIRHNAIGATMPNLNEGIIRRFTFQLPPLLVQAHIADLLDSLDDKIELNRRMNETVEAMARAIFRDWFVDFGPTRAKMERREPYLAPNLWALFPDRLDDDGEPEGWEQKPVGQLSEIVGGATPSTKKPEFWEGGSYAWATPKDLSKREGLFLYETDRSITDAGLATIGSGLSPAGSVLLSSRAPIGYLAIAEQPTAVNQGFIVLRPTEDLPPAFALFWCQSNLETIKANANGSTFQEISKRNFRPLKVVIPDRATMNAFIGVVSPLLDRIRLNGRENRTLAATRDLLLPKLMSGEIRAAEAAELADEAIARGGPQLEAGASP